MQLKETRRRGIYPEPEMQVCVLLVDPDAMMLDVRRDMLARHEIPVYTARNAIEVLCAEPLEEPAIVVLDERLGAPGLEAAAEYVRHRWPQARLLVMSEGEPPLDDHLYDATLAEGCTRAEFLRAIDGCAQMWRIQNKE